MGLPRALSAARTRFERWRTSRVSRTIPEEFWSAAAELAEQHGVHQVLPVIASIRRLYQIEAHAREEKLPNLARLRLRWEQSRPILATLLRQLRRLWKDPVVLPRSSLGVALESVR